MIVYDVTCRASFDNVNSWAEVIQEHAGEGVLTLLVGNKADCIEGRQVDHREAMQLADELGMDYFETSAKSATNVHAAFYSLASKILSSVEQRNIVPVNAPESNALRPCHLL